MADINSEMLQSVLGFLGISAHVRYFLWRRQSVSQNQDFDNITELPEDVSWLNVQTFRVVSAICGE